jgi:hypothetical protein
MPSLCRGPIGQHAGKSVEQEPPPVASEQQTLFFGRHRLSPAPARGGQHSLLQHLVGSAGQMAKSFLHFFLAAPSSIAVPPKARPKAPPTAARTTSRRSRCFPASRFIHPSNRGPSTTSSSDDILRDRSLRRDGCAATANATVVDARSAGSAGVDSGDHQPRWPARAHMPYRSPHCIGLMHDSPAAACERCTAGRCRQRAEGVMANDTRFAALARRLGLARTLGWGLA